MCRSLVGACTCMCFPFFHSKCVHTVHTVHGVCKLYSASTEQFSMFIIIYEIFIFGPRNNKKTKRTINVYIEPEITRDENVNEFQTHMMMMIVVHK